MKKNIVIRASKKILGLAHRYCKLVIIRPLFAIDFLIAKRKTHRNTTLACYRYPFISSKKNICIFSHFDRDNVIDSYVLHYLKELSGQDCDIIFVTTSRYLSLDQRKKLQPFCHKIIIRKNTGRDFGAFKSGIQAIENLAFYNKVILANDSVYGPLYPLDKIIHYGDQMQLDMWGATDSFANQYHIQSYFIVFSKPLIQHLVFGEFWRHLPDLYFRDNIIHRYEIGMSQFFIKKGFKLGAYCPYLRIKESLQNIPLDFDYLLRKVPLNPTHYFWNILVSDHCFPFLKRELISRNPEHLDITHWPDFLKKYTRYNPDLIQQHLNRLAGISSTTRMESS